jgi:hypothetical protein
VATYQYKLGCAVPQFDSAQQLAKALRVFDEEAFIHIKESNDDEYWDLIALFNLDGGMVQYLMVNKLFTNSVADVGGREL